MGAGSVAVRARESAAHRLDARLLGLADRDHLDHAAGAGHGREALHLQHRLEHRIGLVDGDLRRRDDEPGKMKNGTARSANLSIDPNIIWWITVAGLVGNMDCRIKSGNDVWDAISWRKMMWRDRIMR